MIACDVCNAGGDDLVTAMPPQASGAALDLPGAMGIDAPYDRETGAGPVLSADHTAIARDGGSAVAGGVTGHWQNGGDTQAELVFCVVKPGSGRCGVPRTGQSAH